MRPGSGNSLTPTCEATLGAGHAGDSRVPTAFRLVAELWVPVGGEAAVSTLVPEERLALTEGPSALLSRPSLADTALGRCAFPARPSLHQADT